VALTRELNRLDGGQVDELEFFSFGETEGGKVACGPLDSLGCLQVRGRTVGREVLYGLVCNTLER
jgi:hypothetical protein